MGDLKLNIHCCFCTEVHTEVVQMPDGWAYQYEGADLEQSGFCPKHSSVEPFTTHQCIGCVSGWGECGLWKSFAYASGSRTISEDQLDTLRTGVCPFRINGTFTTNIAEGVEWQTINLSEEAVEAGSALADAIVEYMETYP